MLIWPSGHSHEELVLLYPSFSSQWKDKAFSNKFKNAKKNKNKIIYYDKIGSYYILNNPMK